MKKDKDMKNINENPSSKEAKKLSKAEKKAAKKAKNKDGGVGFLILKIARIPLIIDSIP